MKHIFCMLVLLCQYAYGLAQPIPPKKNGINIGEIMPDVMLPNLYNHIVKKGKFSTLQKQLTIIDFWATWCGACVGSFDKMQSLQNSYKDRLQLLMINASPGDDTKKLNVFFQKRKQRTGKDFTLTYSIKDTLLSRMFPFKVIPHCIWVDSNRRVIAITDTEAVTAANIDAVLSGDIAGLPFKNDALLFNEDIDDLLPADSNTAGVLLSQSFITSEQPGRGVKFAYESVSGKEIKKLMILNHSLLGLYQVASAEAFRLSNGRVLVDSAVQFLFREELPMSNRPKFCYELNTKPLVRKEALRWLRTDLERYFKVKAVAGEQWMPVFILKPGKRVSDLFTKNGTAETDLDEESLQPFIRNGSMEDLRYFLEAILHKPVVDETGISNAIDILFLKGFRDFTVAEVSKFLLQNGIELQEGERRMPVTRLTPINN